MFKAAIIGGSGYGGGELCRQLLQHDQIELVTVSSIDFVGQKLGDVHLNLEGVTDLRFEEKPATEVAEGVDVVFAGPQDIAASMGVIGQPRHPDVVEILDGFPERVARFGKPAGITDVGYEHSARWRDRGYRFINIGTLTHLGMTGVNEAYEQLRNGESG